MKKKLLFALIIALLAILIVTAPVFAFNGIQFNIYDAVTLQPWGTTPGQTYRIYVYGSTSAQLLDTGVLSPPPPGDPVLNFTCSFGGACPPGAATLLGMPSVGETVTVYIILTGATSNPSTIIRTYQQPPNLGVPFVISQNTGSGPNVVTMAGANAQSPAWWLPVTLAVVALVGVGGVVLLLRRRRIA